MSTPANDTPANNAPAAIERRARVLHALGITPWQRRALKPQAGAVPPFAGSIDADAPTSASVPSACVVVLPDGCGARELDLLGRALTTYGPVLARAARITVRAGQLVGTVPAVRAYLVFGEAQARALGRDLPSAVARQAQIVLVEEPAHLLTAAAKRRLWSALRQLRRALAASVDG
jgi:hypothetical protein